MFGIMILLWWTTQILVSYDGIITKKFPDTSSSEYSNFTIQKTSKTPILSKNETNSPSLIKENFWITNLPRKITDFIADLRRLSTRSWYKSVIKWWFFYPISRNTDSCTPNVNKVLSFMHGMITYGCLYSGHCAVRSALSSIATFKGYTKLSEHPFDSHSLKVVYNRHSLLPNYTSVWDEWDCYAFYESWSTQEASFISNYCT